MIILYALSTCPWCKKAKQYLDDKGVQYTHIVVDTMTGRERDEVLKEFDRLTRQRAFPILVFGEKVIQGYKEDLIQEELIKAGVIKKECGGN